MNKTELASVQWVEVVDDEIRFARTTFNNSRVIYEPKN